MNKKWGKIIRQIFLLCGMALWVSGCGSSKMWYKSGNSQVDFDLDHNECRRIAEEVSRQATVTGAKINLEVFNTSYNNCLFSRGWTHTPPGGEQKNVQPVVMAEVKGNEIYVFDRVLALPAGFALVSNQVSGFEDVRIQTLFFQGEGPVYLNMTVQEAFSRQFDPVDYPVNDPFFVFEKGKAGNKKRPVNWTVFSGDFKGEWVAGIGAYYLVDKNKRINIVMTSAIPSQKEFPPKGLRLTKFQKMAVEAFSDEWLYSVKTGFGASATGENENQIIKTGKKFMQKIKSFL